MKYYAKIMREWGGVRVIAIRKDHGKYTNPLEFESEVRNYLKGLRGQSDIRDWLEDGKLLSVKKNKKRLFYTVSFEV